MVYKLKQLGHNQAKIAEIFIGNPEFTILKLPKPNTLCMKTLRNYWNTGWRMKKSI